MDLDGIVEALDRLSRRLDRVESRLDDTIDGRTFRDLDGDVDALRGRVADLERRADR